MEIPTNNILPKTISLYELMYKVEVAVEQSVSDKYWVHAEIFKFKSSPNYIRLELSNESSQVDKAKTAGIIWNSNRSIIEKFENTTDVKLSSGE